VGHHYEMYGGLGEDRFLETNDPANTLVIHAVDGEVDWISSCRQRTQETVEADSVDIFEPVSPGDGNESCDSVTIVE
jgi:hypothetical protein